MKTFSRIPLSDHSYRLIVKVNPASSVHLEFVYNNISGGYMGTKIESFIDFVRGLLKEVPNFIDDFDEHDPMGSLKRMGFTEVETSEMKFKLFAR